MKDVRDIKDIKDTSVIPKGIYCYDENGDCPYWSINKEKPEQENGYCSYLCEGDWDINEEGGLVFDVKNGETYAIDYYPFGGRLWDQVKLCGINREL